MLGRYEHEQEKPRPAAELREEATIMQLCLLSKIWYMAQTLLPHPKHVQQLTSMCTWYIWRGAPFRVPITPSGAQRIRVGGP